MSSGPGPSAHSSVRAKNKAIRAECEADMYGSPSLFLRLLRTSRTSIGGSYKSFIFTEECGGGLGISSSRSSVFVDIRMYTCLNDML